MEGVCFPRSLLTTLVLGSYTFPSPLILPTPSVSSPLPTLPPFHRAESGTCMPKSSTPLRTCSWMGKIHVSCCSPGVVYGSRVTPSSEFDRWLLSGLEWMGPPCRPIMPWHWSQCFWLSAKLSCEKSSQNSPCYQTFPNLQHYLSSNLRIYCVTQTTLNPAPIIPI